MIMAGVVLAAQHGSHIAVVILTQKLGAARRWVLTAGALTVAVLYLALAVTAWPLMEIAADERSPILQVPGSVSVGSLMLGFTLLAIVTLCRLPATWSVVEAPHAHEDHEVAATHQGA
jgi:TRAP-type C4-dicarboxylate transport system permease small subunit